MVSDWFPQPVKPIKVKVKGCLHCVKLDVCKQEDGSNENRKNFGLVWNQCRRLHCH